MVEFTLAASDPLRELNLQFDELTVVSITDRALVAIAVPSQGRNALADRLEQAYGTSIPEVGRTTTSNGDNVRFLGMARDQIFMMFDDPGGDPLVPVSRELGSVAYLVDQSDSWVMLSVEGPRSRAALERICPLDLDPGAFRENGVARTVMEHLAVIILRDGHDRFLLLSPRSTAKSFAHAVQVSAENVS
ncbi:MAG: sarcosine oxidase subunit gamma [Hyphomicrobiaceae bacterium]